MQNKVDPFGFKGQAETYDLDRPRYPPHFVQKLLEVTPSRQNYIDIASGTGLLFYELANQFTGALVVNDRSAKQLQVAKGKLKDSKLDSSCVEFVESDIFEIHKNISKPTRFELATIAQALHWVDPGKFCEYAIKELLVENSVLGVLGYFCDGFDYNFSDAPEFAKTGQQCYDKFYSTVLPHFDCDRESLDKGHSNYDFKRHFENFERFDHVTQVELPVENLIKYFTTYSAYNIYKSKFGNDAGFKDPVEEAKNTIEKSLQAHYQKHGLQPKEKPIVMRIHYFMLLLSKAKKVL